MIEDIKPTLYFQLTLLGHDILPFYIVRFNMLTFLLENFESMLIKFNLSDFCV